MLFGIVSYVVWTKRASFGSIGGRTVIAVEVSLLLLFTLMSLFIMATPGSYLPVGIENGMPSFPSFDVTRYFQYHLFIFSYYMVLLLGILASLAYLNYPRAVKDLALSLRPWQTVMFMGIVAAGIAAGWSELAGADYVYNILNKPYWVNLSFVILALLSSMLAWIVTTMWNDLSDHADDEPGGRGARLRRGRTGGAGGGVGGAGGHVLVMGALLSWHHVLLLAVIFALGAIYLVQADEVQERILSPCCSAPALSWRSYMAS